MTTQSDFPTFVVRVQLAPRGDLRVDLLEGAEPFRAPEPHSHGFWCRPDDAWIQLRRELPVALATWIHRLRRQGDADSGQPLPRD